MISLSPEKISGPKSQYPSRAPSPVLSANPPNDITSHKNLSVPRLPSPQLTSQRRSSFSHHDQHDEKQLITQRSFPHLNSPNKKQLPLNKPRRGSEATTVIEEEHKNLSTEPTIRFASDKRNNDFHALFRSVPENEKLIDDYGCALQKEILLQGRIYISEHHLCFNANIFGWVTNLVVAFEDIEDIEKKATAIFIPNAILISTCSSKHFFASFLSRDQAFDQMTHLWKTSQANQNASAIENEELNSAHLNDTMDETDYTSSEYSYSEDEDDYHADMTNTTSQSQIQSDYSRLEERQGSLASLPLPKHVINENAARRRAISESGQQKPEELADYFQHKPEATSAVHSNYNETTAKSLASLNSSLDHNSNSEEKTQVKENTQCECSRKDLLFPTVVMDAVYNTSLETMYNILFNSSFMSKFLCEIEKSTDVCIGDWAKSESCVYSRESSYIKYLGGSIGPKSTKCSLKEEILHLDPSDYICQLTVTQTPDVPAGGSFNVKTKTCLSWSGKGQVRVLVTVLIEFTKSSWLKSTIEKASIDGQQNFYKNLDAAIRKFLHSQVPRTHKASTRRRRKRVGSSRRRHKSHQMEQPVTHKGHLVILSDALSGVIDYLHGLTLSQLISICMVVMITTNLYLVAKLAGFDKTLSQLQSQPPPITDYSMDQRDTLWRLLSAEKPRHFTRHEEESDPHLHASQMTKRTLDKKIIELEKMIKDAGYNMNHVAQMIQDQKENIMNSKV